MKARILILAATIVTALAVSVAPAGAAPPTRASISMSCDRGTNRAVASITLYDGLDHALAVGPTTVECGSDLGLDKSTRIVVPTTFDVGWVVVDGYQVSSGTGTVSCGGEGTPSLKLSCTGSSGTGATVTVR